MEKLIVLYSFYSITIVLDIGSNLKPAYSNKHKYTQLTQI